MGGVHNLGVLVLRGMLALCLWVRLVLSKGDVCLWRHVLQEEAICACFWVDESAALAIAAAACVCKGAADLYSKQNISSHKVIMCPVVADDWGAQSLRLSSKQVLGHCTS